MPESILLADEITVRFGGLVAVDAVSLAVNQRELVGVIGPNGAGKTTFFHALSGVLAPTAGQLKVRGADMTGRGQPMGSPGRFKRHAYSATSPHWITFASAWTMPAVTARPRTTRSPTLAQSLSISAFPLWPIPGQAP
jgi:ABC-type multidrug transport system ATPase subunit